MKKLLRACVLKGGLFLMSSFSFAQTLDGIITSGEYGIHSDGQNQQSNSGTVTYMSWDNNYLYLGVSQADIHEGFVLYLDKNPIIPVNGGGNADGTLVGQSYDGTNFEELPFRADAVFYVKNGYQEFRTADGNNAWSGASTSFGNYADNGSNVREFSIPWSVIGGKPTSFNFYSYLTSSTGTVYGTSPTENAIGAIGVSARYSRYYTVSNTTLGASTPPFSRNSYTFNSSTDISGFGSISVYDFTMNSAGRIISRTGNTAGDWNVSGSLVMANGAIYLGSGGASYGNVNLANEFDLRGGVFDMDNSTGKIFVTKDVTIEAPAELILSRVDGGDIKVGGHWNRQGTFTPKQGTVFFYGSNEHIVTSVFDDPDDADPNRKVEIFGKLTLEDSGTLKHGTATNIRVTTADGLKLASTNPVHTVDLNGKTLNYQGGGNLNLDNKNIKIINSHPTDLGFFRIADKPVSIFNSGSIVFESRTTILLSNEFNPGNAVTTINGTLNINSINGKIINYPPIYGSSSSLRYTCGCTYERGIEWSATSVSATVGLPNNLRISSNTYLDYVNPTYQGNLFIKSNLIIDDTSTLDMSYGGLTSNGSLNIQGNITSTGNIILGSSPGDDLRISGNMSFGAGFTFNSNNRVIYFDKSTGQQAIDAASKLTLHYINLTGTNNIKLTNTSLDVTAPNGGSVITFAASSNYLDLGVGSTVTLGTAGVANVISGNGTLRAADGSSSLIIKGLNSIGNLKFSGATRVLKNLTIDRTADASNVNAIAAVLASDLLVAGTLSLKNGKLQLDGYSLTVDKTGDVTDYSSASYVITNGLGELRRTLDTHKIYPVGSATLYNPIILSNAGTEDVYAIRAIYGDINEPINASDPDDFYDKTNVLKVKWQIREAVAGGSILTAVPQWDAVHEGVNFSKCRKSVNLYNGSYTWLEADANYIAVYPKTATPVVGNFLAPSDLSSGNNFITVGDVHDTTSFIGDAVSGAWNHCEPSRKFKAVIQGDFITGLSTGGNFTARKLTVNSGKSMLVKENTYVYVVNEVVNNGDFTVESDANLVQEKNVSNTGNITVKRTSKLKRLDYNLWGAPVTGQNVRSFSPGTLDTRFYVYNEFNDYFDGLFVRNKYPDGSPSITNPENPATYNFQPAKGYGIRASNYATTTPTVRTFSFQGVPNNGTISIPLSYTNSSRGYNMVSNPYPSNLDLDQLYADNMGDITGAFYFWTNINPNPAMQGSNYPMPGYYNNYAVYNLSGGVPAASPAVCVQKCVADSPTPTHIVKPGQGFLVRATGASKVLDFKNTQRNKDNSGVFFNARKSSFESSRFWLQLKTPLDLVNTILLSYKEGSSAGFEETYDAMLMVESSDSFYSKIASDKYVIQGRGYPFDVTDNVGLGTSYYQSGIHTISIAKKEGIFAGGQPIYLHDKLLGSYTDLQQEDYEFNVQAGAEADRFEIVYQPDSSLGLGSVTQRQLLVYQSGDYVMVKSPYLIHKLSVFEASGKMIYHASSLERGFIQLDAAQWNSGVLFVSVETEKGLFTTKIIKK